MKKAKLLQDATTILTALGMPRAQQNDRSALTLLALLDLKPGRDTWAGADNARLLRIRDVLDFCRTVFKLPYAENTRETFRRQTMHQLVEAGVALYNPDDPGRAVNSPHNCYQVSPEALAVIRAYGTRQWSAKVASFQESRGKLAQRNAKARNQAKVPVTIADGQKITLGPGEHSQLIKAVVEDFAARFVPGAVLVYVGDTGEKWGYFNEPLLAKLGVKVGSHGKMPDAVFYFPKRKWLVLAESVTSHGPVDPKRHRELAKLFAGSKAGLVYVTAFPSRQVMSRYLPQIAWETEVWCADAPSHLIHFNGERFLGPYTTDSQEPG